MTEDKLEIRSRCLDSFESDPFLSLEDRAKKLGTTFHILRSVLSQADRDLLDSIRGKILLEYAAMNEDATYHDISTALSVNINCVVGLLTKLEAPEIVAHRRYVATKRVNIRAKSKIKAENDEKKTAYLAFGDKIKIAKQILREDVFISCVDVAKRTRCSEAAVRFAQKELLEEGFDRKLEREILLAEFLEKNPVSSYKEAADYFGITEARVRKIPGANQLLPNNLVRDLRSERARKLKEEGTEEEREMYARACVRPDWYVADVRSRGWLGVVLPEDEFKRYLELYTSYRCGKANNSTRHITLQGIFNYTPRKK